ncbi:MAG: hypothetical protein JXA93_04585, partial [Anaerolineae bacterium]|nr:hypothetical protein [Anaerolineae bacterium]
MIVAASSADSGAYRSADGGTTWEPVGWYDPAASYEGGFVGGGVQALALGPSGTWDNVALAGTESGLYYSGDRGIHWWQGHDRGMPALDVRAIATAPGAPEVLLAGASFFHHQRVDGGTPMSLDGALYLSVDGGARWRDVTGRLDRVTGVVFSPAFLDDGVAFATTGTLGQHGFADGGVYRSLDGGENWEEVMSDRICRGLAISPDFRTDETVWVSQSTYSAALGLFRSTDGGQTWQALAPDIHAHVLAPSPGYAADQTLFAGTLDAGLQRSTDGGLSWSQVFSRPVGALAVSPALGASRTLYAGVDEPLAAGEIYCSTDGGDTWERVGAEIPAWSEAGLLHIADLAFAVDGSVLAGVYYGSESGDGAVYRSVDGGSSWAMAGTEMGDTSVLDVASVPAGSLRVYAATTRRAPADAGLWKVDIKQGGPAEPGAWTTAGPHGVRAHALAVSPAFAGDGVVLAGEWSQERGSVESGSGIYRSTDGGATWQAATGGMEFVSGSLAVHDLAFSPDFATDGTVFAATGGGVFHSTDGGQSWTWASRLYDGPPGIITSVAVAPDYGASGHVLAGKGWGGVAVSTDGGLNWTVHHDVGGMAAVAYSPGFAADRVAFAGGWASLSRTEDSGATWTEVLTATPIGALALSPAYAVTPTLFVGGDGIYVSNDGAMSWISTTLPGDPFLVSAITLSPAFPADPTLFAGSNEGLYRSPDGGETWAVVAGYPGGAVHAIVLSPAWPGEAVMLVGSDDGVYRSDDGGGTWTLLPGMAPLGAGAVAMVGSGVPAAGTERHGVYLGSAGGTGWAPLGLQQMSSYRVSAIAPSPAYSSDGTMFAALVSRLSIGAMVWRTMDGGSTWETLYSTDYVGGLAVSPDLAQDATVYAGGGQHHVARSTDGGTTWEPVGTWP